MNLINGPLNKTLSTQSFELLVKCLLAAPEAIYFSIEPDCLGNDCLFAEVGRTKINVSDMTQRVNFNHIHLDKSDAELFLHSGFSNEAFSDFPSHSDQPKYAELTYGEKLAINHYTGWGAYTINEFLYGDVSGLSVPFYYQFEDQTDLYQTEMSRAATEILLHMGFAASGLNKILPEIDFDGQTYRGESYISDEAIEARISLIDQHQYLDGAPAFMSTTSWDLIGSAFADNSKIIFESAYGKDVSGLSQFPGEEEYLILPGKIVFHSYELIEGTYHFQASMVAPLTDEDDNVTEDLIADFQGLLEFAMQNEISLDFISDYNRARHISDCALDEEQGQIAEPLLITDILVIDNSNEQASYGQLTLVNNTPQVASSVLEVFDQACQYFCDI